MKRKNAKITVIYILISLLVVFLIYSIFGLLFSNEYEILVTDNNRENINKMIEKYCDEPNKVTRIKLKPLLGDGDLYLYNNFILEKKIRVNEGDDIMIYMCENTLSVGLKYLINTIISLICILLLKSEISKTQV